MNVLKPIPDPQSLLFIPRQNVSEVNLELLNEFTEIESKYELQTEYNNGYMTVALSHDFNEGDRFSYQVKSIEGDLLYRGKIFITSQTDLQNYTLNLLSI